MFFNNYGKVIVAWYLYRAEDSSSTGFNLINGLEYEGKLRIGQYDYLNSETSLEYYREQTKYFGQASAIAYGHWGSTNSNIYLGGSADNEKY